MEKASDAECEFLIDYGVYKMWIDKKGFTDIPPILKRNTDKFKNKSRKMYLIKIFKQLLEKNPQLAEKIKDHYYREKMTYKNVGDYDENQYQPTIIDEYGIHQTNKLSVRDFFACKKNAVCFTYHKGINQLNWLDKKDMGQFKTYRKHYKKKECEIYEENNQEHEINGIKWYSLCITSIDDEGEVNASICKGSIELFSYFAYGLVYYFKTAENRDDMYNYMKKQK